MDGSRRVRTVMLLGLIGVVASLTAGCSSSGAAASSSSLSSSTLPAALAEKLQDVKEIVALGDSVPEGAACRCRPYPELTGDDVASAAGHRVDTSNEAVGGYVSGDVLSQLTNDAKVIRRVEDSQAVIVEVGANDVGYSGECGEQVACYEQKLPQLESNLDAIVARIHQLTVGHEVAVVLLDYWSVWLGGQYATAQGPAYVEAATALTASVNDAIRTTATSSSSTYVDLRTAFKGPDDTWDETHLLASDGDHPNAAGHQRIAEALEDAVVQGSVTSGG
jgi:acyl-CoA thioesterase I